MDFHREIGEEWILPEGRFDNAALIETRAEGQDPTKRTAFRRAMRYLYMADGATNLSREYMLASLPTLEPREKRAIRWSYTRTNGAERKNYGPDSIVAMRKAKFRCQRCGYPDVRTLQVDHVTGRKTKPFVFQCLCANCHAIETYDRTQLPGLPEGPAAEPQMVDTACEACGKTFQHPRGEATTTFEDGSETTICVDYHLEHVRSGAFVERAASRQSFLAGRGI